MKFTAATTNVNAYKIYVLFTGQIDDAITSQCVLERMRKQHNNIAWNRCRLSSELIPKNVVRIPNTQTKKYENENNRLHQIWKVDSRVAVVNVTPLCHSGLNEL